MELSEPVRKQQVLTVINEAIVKIEGVQPALGKPREGGIEHNPALHEGHEDSDDMAFCPNCAALFALKKVRGLLQ